MDKEMLRDSLKALADEAVPAENDPWARISPMVKSAETRTNTNRARSRVNSRSAGQKRTFLKLAAPAAIALALVLTLVMILPQGRAWAQEIIALFTRTEVESFPLSDEQIEGANQAAVQEPLEGAMPTAAPPETLLFFSESCPGLGLEGGLVCQVRAAEVSAGFHIHMPSDGDSGLELTSLAFDTTDETIQLGFGYAGFEGTDNSVWIQQSDSGFPDGSDWEKVPARFVESTSVLGNPAEYVRGGFVVRPGASKATWEQNVPMGRLRWVQDGYWFEIFKAGNPENVTFMDQRGMVELAESLAPLPEAK